MIGASNNAAAAAALASTVVKMSFRTISSSSSRRHSGRASGVRLRNIRIQTLSSPQQTSNASLVSATTHRWLARRQHSSLQQQQQHHHPHEQLQHQHHHQQEDWNAYATYLFRGLLAVGMIHCFSEYVAEITLCEGPSMHPTLLPAGEIVLIDKFTLRRIHGRTPSKKSGNGGDPLCQGKERLEIALKRQAEYEKQSDDHLDQWHEARISVSDLTPSWSMLWTLLTTPLSIGDVIVLQHPNRKGTICKRVLGLPGDTVLRPGRKGLLVIPDGQMWVEGDNPANSSDSRAYGTVPMALIQGRVLCRVWPLRGQAVMARGAPPRPSSSSPLFGGGGPKTGYTILPTGYEGQHIVKTMNAAASVKTKGSS